jgi:hypothetical protein
MDRLLFLASVVIMCYMAFTLSTMQLEVNELKTQLVDLAHKLDDSTLKPKLSDF